MSHNTSGSRYIVHYTRILEVKHFWKKTINFRRIIHRINGKFKSIIFANGEPANL